VDVPCEWLFHELPHLVTMSKTADKGQPNSHMKVKKEWWSICSVMRHLQHHNDTRTMMVSHGL